MDREVTVLNLGAGVQSTWLRLNVPHDVAVYADTQQEPQWVYDHLAWLEHRGGPPILKVTAGDLGEGLIHGHNGKVASIPAFTAMVPGVKDGILQRQCTKAYKQRPIERAIRREVLGLPCRVRCRVPNGIMVNQLFGISADEAGRAARITASIHPRWTRACFPLLDRQMTRVDCERSLQPVIPHQVRRSSCIFCPFHSNAQWMELRAVEPSSWERAVEIDRLLRMPGTACNRAVTRKLYLHSSCQPLADLDCGAADVRQMSMFFMDCLGGCGN